MIIFNNKPMAKININKKYYKNYDKEKMSNYLKSIDKTSLATMFLQDFGVLIDDYNNIIDCIEIYLHAHNNDFDLMYQKIFSVSHVLQINLFIFVQKYTSFIIHETDDEIKKDFNSFGKIINFIWNHKYKHQNEHELISWREWFSWSSLELMYFYGKKYQKINDENFIEFLDTFNELINKNEVEVQKKNIGNYPFADVVCKNLEEYMQLLKIVPKFTDYYFLKWLINQFYIEIKVINDCEEVWKKWSIDEKIEYFLAQPFKNFQIQMENMYERIDKICKKIINKFNIKLD